jgi:membrane fusion protein (multidrug efflux system)
MATTETEPKVPQYQREKPAQNDQVEQSQPQRTSFRERRRSALKNPRVRLLLIMGAVVVVVAGIAAWRYFTSYESTDDAQIDGHLSSISARVSGHVIRLNVRDNERVEAGAALVEIDPTDYQVAVDRAKADYADAIASYQAAEASVPITSVSTTGEISSAEANVNNSRAAIAAATQQYQAAKAQLEQAQANNTNAQSDLTRYRQLVEKQEVSQQQYDQALANAQSSAAAVQAAAANVSAAEQQIVQARGKLDQAEANLRSANTGPKQVAVIRAKAAAAQAVMQRKKADLEQAELNLQYTKVVAPLAGVVSNRTVEVGQNVQAGQQLLTVIPLEDLWVTANFKETQLAHMHPGRPVSIFVDANGKTYNGHVDSIAGASGSRFSLLPPENATGNYVKVVQRIPVKIDFDSGELKAHELRPGMSVEPKVWIRK